MPEHLRRRTGACCRGYGEVGMTRGGKGEPLSLGPIIDHAEGGVIRQRTERERVQDGPGGGVDEEHAVTAPVELEAGVQRSVGLILVAIDDDALPGRD